MGPQVVQKPREVGVKPVWKIISPQRVPRLLLFEAPLPVLQGVKHPHVVRFALGTDCVKRPLGSVSINLAQHGVPGGASAAKANHLAAQPGNQSGHRGLADPQPRA